MQDKVVEQVVSDQVEDALRKLLSEKVAELTKQGEGGPKCWAAVLFPEPHAEDARGVRISNGRSKA